MHPTNKKRMAENLIVSLPKKFRQYENLFYKHTSIMIENVEQLVEVVGPNNEKYYTNIQISSHCKFPSI
jgi:5-bromo-4-chloroindolyl phosphate hydrolysis protein